MNIITYIGTFAILYSIYSIYEDCRKRKEENEKAEEIEKFKREYPVCVNCGSSHISSYKAKDSWDHYREIVFICRDCHEEYKMNDGRRFNISNGKLPVRDEIAGIESGIFRSEWDIKYLKRRLEELKTKTGQDKP